LLESIRQSALTSGIGLGEILVEERVFLDAAAEDERGDGQQMKQLGSHAGRAEQAACRTQPCGPTLGRRAAPVSPDTPGRRASDTI